MVNETAYPLSWPAGWKRTPRDQRLATAPFTAGESYTKTDRRQTEGGWVERERKASRSKPVTVAVAVERLEQQLGYLDARGFLSTNLELRLNGMPRSGQPNPDDSGAAVYFTLRGKRTVLACDKWLRVADNVAALAAHIRALRSIENYGVGTLEQAFRGYTALEDFSSGTIPWRRVLGFKDDATVGRDQVEEKYRSLMKRYHTDITGGDHLQSAQLNLAIVQAREELGDHAHQAGE